MTLQEEIFKPTVKIIPDDNSGTVKPENCIFEVHIKFRLINGVAPYPDLIYNSEKRQISKAQSNSAWLLEKLQEKIDKHKRKHDFIREKQAIVDAFLNQTWGE